MSRNRRLLSTTTTALAGAALLTGGFAGAVPAQAAVADVIVVQPYRADSGDRCPMGLSSGRLGWHLGSRTVDVRGTVTDRPLPTEPITICDDDGRFTAATFTAHAADGSSLASSVQRADNDQRGISFTLNTTKPIAAIVVQVCRHSPIPGPPDYCGAARKFNAPVPATG